MATSEQRGEQRGELEARAWQGAQTGHSRVVIGALGGVPAPPEGWWTVRVRCDGPPRMLGPVHEARRQVDRLVGARTPVVELAADRFRSGLRRRLLGDETEPQWPDDGDLVADLNRLADTVDGPAALVFDAVDAADAATLAFLQRVVARPGWLKPALVLGLRGEPRGRVAALVDAVRDGEGFEAVQAAASPAEPAPAPPELPPLGFAARQVLRAAATVGDGFEVELVARLLDRPALDVLCELQAAYDAGVALDDLGDGRFSLPAALAATLRGELLPSLHAAWNRRLATLLAEAGGEPEPPVAAPAATLPPPAEAPAERVEVEAAVSPADAEARARAARHSAEAGDVDIAVQRYLTAARQLADRGAVDQAIAYAREALGLLEALPRTAERRRLAAMAHATVGRLSWTGSGQAGAFPLEAARKELELALKLLADTDDVSLKAEVRRLLASVAYDQGDDESLDRALAELTEASRELARAGEARAGARLLNDQAAVLVAMGDPVRAAHLLEESLETFQALSARAARAAQREARTLTPDEAADRREVAETLLLMARLPLTVHARPGREQEALVRAQEHAAEAERIYEELAMERELGRVWQTRGQLARQAGERGPARDFLNRAARVQMNLGDAVGLACTTETMAALLGDLGEQAEALRMLVDSIRLNHGKGSPRGLARNRAALQRLAQGMSEADRARLAPLIVAVRRQLEAAEGQLGRVELAGE